MVGGGGSSKDVHIDVEDVGEEEDDGDHMPMHGKWMLDIR